MAMPAGANDVRADGDDLAASARGCCPFSIDAPRSGEDATAPDEHVAAGVRGFGLRSAAVSVGRFLDDVRRSRSRVGSGSEQADRFPCFWTPWIRWVRVGVTLGGFFLGRGLRRGDGLRRGSGLGKASGGRDDEGGERQARVFTWRSPSSWRRWRRPATMVVLTVDFGSRKSPVIRTRLAVFPTPRVPDPVGHAEDGRRARGSSPSGRRSRGRPEIGHELSDPRPGSRPIPLRKRDGHARRIELAWRWSFAPRYCWRDDPLSTRFGTAFVPSGLRLGASGTSSETMTGAWREPSGSYRPSR